MIIKIKKTHSMRTMNISYKWYGNSFNDCWNISQWTKFPSWWMVVVEKFSHDDQSYKNLIYTLRHTNSSWWDKVIFSLNQKQHMAKKQFKKLYNSFVKKNAYYNTNYASKNQNHERWDLCYFSWVICPTSPYFPQRKTVTVAQLRWIHAISVNHSSVLMDCKCWIIYFSIASSY